MLSTVQAYKKGFGTAAPSLAKDTCVLKGKLVCITTLVVVSATGII